MELRELREAAREQVEAAANAPQPGGLPPYQRRRIKHALRLGGAAVGSVAATLVLIWFMVASLASRPPAGPPGAVSGRVTNFANVSITGVRVYVNGATYQALTGPTGEFTLEGVPSGRQEVSIELAGISGMTVPVNVLAFKTVDIGTVELYTP